LKIKVHKDFTARFAIAASVAPNRSPSVVLRNVRVDASKEGILLQATDTEKGISVTASGEVIETGAILLPRDRALAIFREIVGDEITIESDENEIVISSATASFKLPSENPMTFPRPMKDLEQAGIALDGTQFRDMMAMTYFATDPDSTRFALGGVMLEVTDGNLLAVGTDGRRLSVARTKISDYVGPLTTSGKTIVPKHFVASLIHAIDTSETCTIIADDSNFLVKNDGIVFTARLIEGRFPNWNNVVPNVDGWPTATIASESFEKLVKQAQITQDGETRGIQLSFDSNKMTAASEAKDIGSSKCEADCKYEGNDIKIRLDSKFLLDFANIVEPELPIDIRLTSGIQPVLLSPRLNNEIDYRYVVMPMSSE
jgi:DNA polymerase III subunit beta